MAQKMGRSNADKLSVIQNKIKMEGVGVQNIRNLQASEMNSLSFTNKLTRPKTMMKQPRNA